MRVYLDNAATTKVSESVIEKMIPLFSEVYGNPSSLHTMGQEAKERIEEAREVVAKCIGANANEIYFTSGGSEGDNQAIISAAKMGERKGKKHIITTAIEHHAVLHTMKKLEKEGFSIDYLPVNNEGNLSSKKVLEAIREDTCLVSVMTANNEIGTILPVSEIGKICREKGVLFHTDAVQAVGHIPVNVSDMNADMLSFSAHKFHGPKGVGVLYAKKGVLLSNIIEGGAQEKGKRAGTENVAGIVGLATALKEATENLETDMKKISALRDKLICGLSKIPRSVLNGDKINRLPSNVHFCFEGIEGESLLLLLDEYGVEGSSGSACTSGSLDPSHVLLAIGHTHEIAHGSLRLTLSKYTTEEEIDYTVKAVKECVCKLRNMSPVWRDKVNGLKPFIL